MKTPDDYRGPLGTEYELPTLLGGTAIPILEMLWGLPWGEIPLCFIRAVNPSYIRVTNGETKTDARPQRVTVYVDENDVIERIEQEVTIAGGTGYEMGVKLEEARAQSLVTKTKKTMSYNPHSPDGKWIVALSKGFLQAGARQVPLVPDPEVIERCIRSAMDQSRKK